MLSAIIPKIASGGRFDTTWIIKGRGFETVASKGTVT
jgi:hypothetical protein